MRHPLSARLRARSKHFPACVVAGLALATLVAGFAATLLADEGSTSPAIVRVEEDWELVVGDPDPDNLSPQATIVFTPLAAAEGLYAALDINHHSQPEFSSGGLQLQVWRDDEPLATAQIASHTLLHHNNENVRWTQSLNLADGNLTFAVTDGQSDTWGEFGAAGQLSLTVGTTLNNLSSYNPATSVSNSGIGFSANRVKSLKLKRVRAYNAAGEVTLDPTERAVYERE